MQLYWYFTWDFWQDLTVIVRLILCGLFYAIGACFVSERYFEFERAIWNLCDIGIENQEDQYYFTHLLNFLSKYLLTVKIGSLVVPKKGCSKFVIVFIAAKLLSYSVKWIYK